MTKTEKKILHQAAERIVLNHNYLSCVAISRSQYLLQPSYSSRGNRALSIEYTKFYGKRGLWWPGLPDDRHWCTFQTQLQRSLLILLYAEVGDL